MSEMVRWKDVRPGDVVVLSGVDHEVVSIEGGLVSLSNGSKGRPGMSGFVEVVAPSPAEALDTAREVLGATVLAVQGDGKPYRCPPLARLAAEPERLEHHLSVFHAPDAVGHEPGSASIPHQH